MKLHHDMSGILLAETHKIVGGRSETPSSKDLITGLNPCLTYQQIRVSNVYLQINPSSEVLQWVHAERTLQLKV